MTDYVLGKITGHGPIESSNIPKVSFAIVYLANDGEARPLDLDPHADFIHALPMENVTVDMDTLDLTKSKYVKVTSRKFKNKAGQEFEGWVEEPRFTPYTVVPPSPVATVKTYNIELTVTGTITEVTQ